MAGIELKKKKGTTSLPSTPKNLNSTIKKSSNQMAKTTASKITSKLNGLKGLKTPVGSVLKSSSKKPLSLGEQLAQFESSAPIEFDPEGHGQSEDEREQFDDYVVPEESQLRKALSLELNDPKYSGKKISRKELYDDNEDDNDSFDQNSEVENGFEDEQNSDIENGFNNEFEDEIENENDNENEKEDDDSIRSILEPKKKSKKNEKKKEKTSKKKSKKDKIGSDNEDEEDNEQKMFSNLKVNNEVEKGKHVKLQLKTYDSLLDLRIRLQRAIATVNRLPKSDLFQEFVDHQPNKFKKQTKGIEEGLQSLLDELIGLRQLLSQNEELKPNNKRKREEFESYVDYAWSEIESADKSLLPFQSQVIEKWNSRVSATSNLTSKKLKVFNQSPMKQIEMALQDKNKLLEKIHTKKSEFKIIGEMSIENVENQVDEEILDDSDFYQSLLRELIEAKTSEIDPDDPVALTRQWLATQQLRQKKKKKNVDTKASKGRKVRYHVHPKLVNFMVPIPKFGWTEEMTNELFSSIGGKNYQTEAQIQSQFANHNGHHEFQGDDEDAKMF